jgi:AraC-like DNA-binding protein
MVMTSIRLFRGAFGHVSVLDVACDFVTHAHHHAHIILWLDGAAGTMTIGHDVVALGVGMAAGINAYQPHSHALAHDGRTGRFLAFYIDQQWANARRGRPAGEELFAKPAIRIDPWIRGVGMDLVDRLGTNDIDDLIDYEVERLIDSLLDSADALRPRARGTNAARISTDFRVRKAIELMKARVCDRICFDEVARRVGLSRPHFFALFKEQTNLTPNVYWNTLRMEEALRQLQMSREPLTSVACNLGFTSQGNFSRFFRDHAGVPPTLYRDAATA